jgi:hypothetical protein
MTTACNIPSSVSNFHPTLADSPPRRTAEKNFLPRWTTPGKSVKITLDSFGKSRLKRSFQLVERRVRRRSP